jgi:DNA-binding GntR family transcriptional regulator
VRDALAVLEQRHLAVRVPRKGVIVRPVTADGVRSVFAARRLLEVEITRLAAERISTAELGLLGAIIARQRAAAPDGDLAVLRAIDREFHSVVWRACGNEVLEELARTVWLRALAARAVGHRAPGWGEKSIERHARILDALERRDAAGAARAARGAVDGAAGEIIAQLEGTETAP